MFAMSNLKTPMSLFLRRTIIVVTAMILGFISAHFFASWYNVIPWVIVAVIIGYESSGTKDIIINGSLFGYFVFLFYLLTSNIWNSDIKASITFSGFSLAFSVVGIFVGIAGVYIGNFIREKIIHFRP